MTYTREDHTFVICAYGESPYLEACIRSLREQTVPTRILMATSTPNALLRAAAERWRIPLFIREGESGLAADWNFALRCAETSLVTLAHQDDVYADTYTEKMLAAMNRAQRPILFSSGYAELRRDKTVTSNRLLNIKKLLRVPMRLLPGSVRARRLSLAFGDSICCPSVTYVREIALAHPFREELRCSLDWQQWETLSREQGSFVFCGEALVLHRIHPDSETSRVLAHSSRQAEDLATFRAFWPEKTARFLAARYAKSEESNRL